MNSLRARLAHRRLRRARNLVRPVAIMAQPSPAATVADDLDAAATSLMATEERLGRVRRQP